MKRGFYFPFAVVIVSVVVMRFAPPVVAGAAAVCFCVGVWRLVVWGAN